MERLPIVFPQHLDGITGFGSTAHAKNFWMEHGSFQNPSRLKTDTLNTTKDRLHATYYCNPTVGTLPGLQTKSTGTCIAIRFNSHVNAATELSDQDITDAYIYLLGRELVLKQEQIDFQSEGFKWN